MKNSRGQVGVEYMIVVAFVTFAILIVLSFGIFYSAKVQDRIRLNQVESFAFQVVNSAETVFFSGEPSKTTLRLSLPSGVETIEVLDEGLVITVNVNGGENVRLFESRVPLTGSMEVTEGIHIITLTATEDSVILS